MEGKLYLKRRANRIDAEIKVGIIPYKCDNLDLKNLDYNETEVIFDRASDLKVIYIQVKRDNAVLLDLRSQSEVVPVDNSVFKQVRDENIRRPEARRPEAKGHAPYNFVPLNQKVVSAQIENQKLRIPCTFDTFHSDRFTGYVDLNIETKSPVYIRGLSDIQDLESNDDCKDKVDFFQPDKTPAIPGSSLRGLIRQMVEMVSFSKFEYVDDQRFYYRAMADINLDLRDLYKNKMVSETKRNGRRSSEYRMSAGILSKHGFKYHIQPVIWSAREDRITKDDAKRLLSDSSSYWPQNIYHIRDHFLVVSGNMPGKRGKKHDWRVSKEPNGQSFNV